MAKKKAFLVGINDYAPVGPQEDDHDLQGCVNDVRDLARTLVVCGFEPSDIRLCTDRQATKEGILKGLQWLVNGASTGDALVFSYSGHGSQVVDQDGDETDRKDEILCPHDLNWADKTWVSDDDLRSIFSTLPDGVNLELIIDSCHSGTMTKGARIGPRNEAACVQRYFEAPIDFTFHMGYDPDMRKKRLLKGAQGKKEVVLVPGLNHVLWAACRDNQTSDETTLEGEPRGVFTYHFCRVLRKSNGKITRDKLEKLVAADIQRGGWLQVLQLETSASELKGQIFT